MTASGFAIKLESEISDCFVETCLNNEKHILKSLESWEESVPSAIEFFDYLRRWTPETPFQLTIELRFGYLLERWASGKRDQILQMVTGEKWISYDGWPTAKENLVDVLTNTKTLSKNELREFNAEIEFISDSDRRILRGLEPIVRNMDFGSDWIVTGLHL